MSKSSDNSGNGGRIELNQVGDIVTEGDRSFAIIAQSLGGGGGLVDDVFADSAGGAGTAEEVVIDLDGSVAARGANSTAVFAQSRGSDGNGDISLELAAGRSIFAGVDGEAVRFSGGSQNSLVNRGQMSTEDSLTGSVLVGEEGNEQVDNFGSFLGQFALGGGEWIHQPYQGTLTPGPELDLGLSSNRLLNDGTMTVGGEQNAQLTNLSGSFVQSSTGVTNSELDFDNGNAPRDGGDMDRLVMTVSLTWGELNLTLVNPQLVPSGRFQKSVFNASEGVTDNGMQLVTAPSVVILYNLVYPSRTEAAVDYKVDFSPDEGNFSDNLNQVGDYVNRIQSAGSSPALADMVIRLLYIGDMPEYRFTLSQMGPDFYGELQADMLRRTERFSELLADGGGYSVVSDDILVWASYETERVSNRAYGDYKQNITTTDRNALGIQRKYGDTWVGGLGFAADRHQSSGYQGRWDADGDTRQVGVILKNQLEDAEFVSTLYVCMGTIFCGT